MNKKKIIPSLKQLLIAACVVFILQSPYYIRAETPEQRKGVVKEWAKIYGSAVAIYMGLGLGLTKLEEKQLEKLRRKQLENELRSFQDIMDKYPDDDTTKTLCILAKLLQETPPSDRIRREVIVKAIKSILDSCIKEKAHQKTY